MPGICGINEPIIFGTPIVLNPILSSFTPFFAQGFLSALDIRNVIFMFVLIAISVVVYYPFFKVYEKNTLEHEGE